MLSKPRSGEDCQKNGFLEGYMNFSLGTFIFYLAPFVASISVNSTSDSFFLLGF